MNPDTEKAQGNTSAGRATRSQAWRPKSVVVSFRHAAEGIAHAFRTQRNMRFHTAAFAAMFLAGMVLRLPRMEMIALVFVCALVLISELFNTAIEATVDMITDRYHPAAKFVKDIAAGAVLVSAITAAVVGCIIFLGALNLEVSRQRMLNPSTVPQFVGAFLLLMVLVLALKVTAGKGTLLYGGAISGHTAVAFFMATAVVVLAPHIWVGVFAYGIAALVGQTRVEAKAHTVREVIVGAIAGTLAVLLLLRVPMWIARLLPKDASSIVRPR